MDIINTHGSGPENVKGQHLKVIETQNWAVDLLWQRGPCSTAKIKTLYICHKSLTKAWGPVQEPLLLQCKGRINWYIHYHMSRNSTSSMNQIKMHTLTYNKTWPECSCRTLCRTFCTIAEIWKKSKYPSKVEWSNYL